MWQSFLKNTLVIYIFFIIPFFRLLGAVMDLTNNLPIPENSTEKVVLKTTNFAVSVQRVELDSDSVAELVFTSDDLFEENNTNGDSQMERRPTSSIDFPQSIFNRSNYSGDVRVAFSVFLTDSLFQRRDTSNQNVGSNVVSFSVIGRTLRDLEPPVTITLGKTVS